MKKDNKQELIMGKEYKEYAKGYLTDIHTNRFYRDYTNLIKIEGNVYRYVYKNVKENDLKELRQLHPSEEVLISSNLDGGIRFAPIFVEFLIEGIIESFYEVEA